MPPKHQYTHREQVKRPAFTGFHHRKPQVIDMPQQKIIRLAFQQIDSKKVGSARAPKTAVSGMINSIHRPTNGI